MKTLQLQKWEESDRGWGIRPDGFSLHLTVEKAKERLDVDQEEKSICGHSEAVKTATAGRVVKGKLHWSHRELSTPSRTIPPWCPLKHGAKY